MSKSVKIKLEDTRVGDITIAPTEDYNITVGNSHEDLVTIYLSDAPNVSRMLLNSEHAHNTIIENIEEITSTLKAAQKSPYDDAFLEEVSQHNEEILGAKKLIKQESFVYSTDIISDEGGFYARIMDNEDADSINIEVDLVIDVASAILTLHRLLTSIVKLENRNQ